MAVIGGQNVVTVLQSVVTLQNWLLLLLASLYLPCHDSMIYPAMAGRNLGRPWSEEEGGSRSSRAIVLSLIP
jgi:hypothetical protein